MVRCLPFRGLLSGVSTPTFLQLNVLLKDLQHVQSLHDYQYIVPESEILQISILLHRLLKLSAQFRQEGSLVKEADFCRTSSNVRFFKFSHKFRDVDESFSFETFLNKYVEVDKEISCKFVKNLPKKPNQSV